MTSTLNTPLLLALFVLLATFFVRKLSKSKVKPNSTSHEPPCVPTNIPFIGHAIGIFRYKTGYYTKLCKKYNLPIFSVSILGSKTHIITSPDLIQALHRQPRAASFWFFEAHFASLLGGVSKASSKSFAANLEPGAIKTSLLVEGLKKIQYAMSPQGGMNEMSRTAADFTKSILDEMEAKEGKRVDLWDWVQHFITVATTESVYGEGNPYRDEKVERGFWDFADGTISVLIASGLPKNGFIASKALAGRETVIKAMDHYFASGAHQNGSSLVKARYSALNGNIDDPDLARYECVNGIAVLANTVPTAFWTIFHIFSDPLVLKEAREQVESITKIEGLASEGVVRKINLTKLKEAPLLSSSIQEAMRLRATGTGPRMVLQDLHLGPQNFLLKKDSVIIIANEALHHNLEIWGEYADIFRAHRFCEKTPMNAFRGFGGGVNMCPGRNFAMIEVSALVAMLVLRFDLVPEGGVWREPGQDLKNMSVQTAPPMRKVVVDLVQRQNLGEGSWEFEFGGT